MRFPIIMRLATLAGVFFSTLAQENADMQLSSANVMTTVNYTDPYDGAALMGYSVVSADLDPKDKKASRPIVVVIPDWDGVNEYEQARASMLADMGWVAFAADIFGIENYQPESFPERAALTGLYRGNLTLYNSRIQTAIEAASMIPGADPSMGVALIGYCFGGSGVLNFALSGQTGADASVAFHGGLNSVAVDLNTTVTAQVLIVSGGEDSQDSTADIKAMEDALNAGGNLWEIARYSDVEHGFTDFFSTGRYNEYVDERSWSSTMTFLQKVFEEIELSPSIPAELSGTTVNYIDPVDGSALVGYVATPAAMDDDTYPAVVIIHDADGIDEYEETRAQMLTEMGYVGFAADIYGPMKNEVNMANRTELFGMLNFYRDNIDLFVQRMNAAVTAAQEHPMVDPDKIAIIGYCFGGTAVINYAMTGQSDAKAVVSFHGGLSKRAPVGGKIHVRMMIASGGEDDAASDIEDLENAMKEGMPPAWEYTRYQGVEHAFTKWTDTRGRYNLHADVRSWEAMSTFLQVAFDENKTEVMDTDMPPGMPTMMEVAETAAPTMTATPTSESAAPTLSYTVKSTEEEPEMPPTSAAVGPTMVRGAVMVAAVAVTVFTFL